MEMGERKVREDERAKRLVLNYIKRKGSERASAMKEEKESEVNLEENGK